MFSVGITQEISEVTVKTAPCPQFRQHFKSNCNSNVIPFFFTNENVSLRNLSAYSHTCVFHLFLEQMVFSRNF